MKPIKIKHPTEIQEFGEAHKDEVEIEGVVVLGYCKDSEHWLALEWEETGTIWLVGGGKNKNEDYFDAAKRELLEETGYKEYSYVYELGAPVISHYYNENKKSYRKSFGYCYLFIFDSDKAQIKQSLEAHENFEAIWTTYEELVNSIKKTGGGVDHWLEALRRGKLAIEMKLG